jgi:nucleotide-binding universal stress UspA family protein
LDLSIQDEGKDMVKDILVTLSVGSSSDVVGEFAITVASAFDAHLDGIAFAYQPVIPGTPFDGVIASTISTCRAESRKRAQTVHEAFEAAAKRAGLHAVSRVLEAGSASASDTFGRMARTYDLSVVSQAHSGDELAEDLIIEAALFSSGRPVLVVPYIQKAGLKLDRVMVCWDGSRNAARAVADAMPLLKKAKLIDVVTVDSRERRNDIAGVEITEHLARHGLMVELKPIVASDSDVASAILSYAADASIDLIVMGGYGHSRLREFILDGATRKMLEAMTVPTLMAH